MMITNIDKTSYNNKKKMPECDSSQNMRHIKR